MKSIIKHTNLKKFTLECDDTPKSDYGTVRLKVYGITVHSTLKMNKINFVRTHPHYMLKNVVESMPPSPLRERLIEAVIHKDIPTYQELKPLLILHKLAT